jgi:hypothetical protein
MTPDQLFVVAIAGIVANAVVSWLTYQKARSTHDVVNGMQAKRVRAARKEGVASGRRMKQAPPPLENIGSMGKAGRPPVQ